MSPSESELRAQQSADAGDTVDGDARTAARDSRRRRLRNRASVGGAVVAVLAVGGIVAGIQLRHNDKATAGSAPTAGSTPPAPVTATCPTGAPALQHGAAGGPVFPADVRSIEVCVYNAHRLSASKTVAGPAARSYAQRFNALPTKMPMCPPYVTQTTLALLPTTSGGGAPMVTAQVGGCGTVSSSGGLRGAANELLNELLRGTATSPIPTLPSHVITHGPVSS